MDNTSVMGRQVIMLLWLKRIEGQKETLLTSVATGLAGGFDVFAGSSGSGGTARSPAATYNCGSFATPAGGRHKVFP